MDLCYDSFNVQSRLSPGLLYIHQAGIVAPAMHLPRRRDRPATSVTICIASCWSLDSLNSSPPSRHLGGGGGTEGERNRGGDGGGGGIWIEQQCD